VKRSKFTDEPIVAIVKAGEAGRKVADSTTNVDLLAVDAAAPGARVEPARGGAPTFSHTVPTSARSAIRRRID
jgi:hypothetical protein